jgi:hypothetical protein
MEMLLWWTILSEKIYLLLQIKGSWYIFYVHLEDRARLSIRLGVWGKQAYGQVRNL